MNLDVVKLYEERSPMDSKSSLARFLEKMGISRPIKVVGTIYDTVHNVYKKDDWDVLLTEDEQDIHELFAKDFPVFSFFPIVRYQFVNGINLGTKFLSSASHACSEAADFLVCAEIWVMSQYQKSTYLSHYGQFFTDELIDQMRNKTRVVYPGIDLEGRDIQEPKKMGKEGRLRIFFPHRMSHQKGLDHLQKYLRTLKRKDPSLRITLVSGKARVKVWREIKEEFEVEIYTRLPRSQYLIAATGCDVVFAFPRLETFGLAVMESVAMGCRPVLCNDLSYPELYPEDTLFNNTDQAAEATLNKMGTRFDNSFVQDYLWDKVAPSWKMGFDEVYSNFYGSVDTTKTGQAIIDAVREVPRTKDQILKFLGWGSQKGWGKYRCMLKQEGLVGCGPNPLFGTPEGRRSAVVLNNLF